MILRGAVAALLGLLALSTPVIAAADPGAPVPGTPCSPSLVGAMAFAPGAKAPLVCGGNRWGAVTDPYPVSDRWLSSGPPIELHGQGRSNPSMLSGTWTGTPSTDTARCHATQVAVDLYAPVLGAPRTDDGKPGQPVTVEVAPTMATIELSGDCLWQKQGAGPGAG